ncbi:MAG: hypothetical protein ABH829_03935 [archaeon]
MQRGIELSIQMLVILALALIVLVTVSIFFSSGATNFMSKIFKFGKAAGADDTSVIENTSVWANPFSSCKTKDDCPRKGALTATACTDNRCVY